MKKLISLALVLVLCLSVSAAMAETFGLGTYVATPAPKDASTVDGEKYDGSVTYNATVCALVLGDDGKIISCQFDSIQSKSAVTTEGTFKTATSISKQAAKDNYNMKKYGNSVAEWYEQANSFGAWCVGKTVEEVLGMKTYARDEEHNCVPDVEDLKTTVTINVGDFLEALRIAAENAK